MRAFIAASACLVALAGPASADDQECPAAFRGATVAAVKVTDGVRLDFRNPNTSHVKDMRMQLREISEMLEQHGTQMQTASDDEVLDFPPVDIAVRDIPKGARVTVRAARLRDIPVIRELAYGFAEFWASSPCAAELVTLR